MVLRRFTKEVFTYADYKQALSEFVAKKEAEAAKGSGSASLRSVLQGWRPRNRSCGTLRLRGHKTVLPDGRRAQQPVRGLWQQRQPQVQRQQQLRQSRLLQQGGPASGAAESELQ